MLLEISTLDGIKKTQKVKISCDRCQQVIEKFVYSVISQREKRNGEDVCRRCSTIEYNQNRPIEVRKKAGDGFKNKYLGKKLEEIVGEKKAIEIKRKFSESSSGENNSNFGGKYSRGFADRPLYGLWESVYGIEKSKQKKLQLSKLNSGSGNPMFGKPAPKKSGNGISGWYGNVYFRSLLELSYMMHLDSLSIKYISCESEKYRFEYEIDGIKRNYFPDFFIPSTNEYIEVKPSQMLSNEIVIAKAKAVQALGHKFTFMTQKDIMKIKKDELMSLISTGKVTIDKGKEKWL